MSNVNFQDFISDAAVSIYSNTFGFAQNILASPAQWGAIMNLVRLKEQRDRLAEALEQWQPIETAPKDRSFILSAHPEHGYLITRWLGAREMWDGWAIEPTHWMSLPKLTTP